MKTNYLRMLTTTCYTVCIVCIVVGTVLSIAMVWLPESEWYGKGIATVAIVFGASLMTLLVTRSFFDPAFSDRVFWWARSREKEIDRQRGEALAHGASGSATI